MTELVRSKVCPSKMDNNVFSLGALLLLVVIVGTYQFSQIVKL